MRHGTVPEPMVQEAYGEAREEAIRARERITVVLSASLAAAVTLTACVAPATQGGDPAHDAVLRYCERFAAAAPARLLSQGFYVAGSARVVRTPLGAVTTFASNVFQPRESRFVDAWRCTFSVSMDGRRCTGEVELPIAEHAEFADYTRWPRLAIIKGHRIVSADGATIGYATPKYFETSCQV